MVKRLAENRIALFVPSLAAGGAERVMIHLAQTFAQRGLEVDLVLATQSGTLLADVPPGIQIVDLAAGGVLKSLPRLVKYLRRKRPFALLSTLDHANIIAVCAKHLSFSGTRVVIREAAPVALEATAWKGIDRYMPLGARFFYLYADAIIAVSQAVADDLTGLTRSVLKKIHVIYNPVPVETIQDKGTEPVEHPWFQPGEPPVIVAIGRMVKRKDFATLIRAFHKVQHTQEVRLVIFGEGEERDALETLIQELGLQNKVMLAGLTNKPYAYLRRAAMLVLSSWWEGFPNVILEALACGCPVVTTRCPGADELLMDERYGKLVPVKDDKAMAAAICDTLAAPTDHALLEQYVRERFSPGRIADQYLEVLRDS
jgi:glycosyltransferase involved in cell wall biosynthesis